MIRIRLAQHLDDGGFGHLVHFGDEIALLFGCDLEQIHVERRTVDELAGAARALMAMLSAGCMAV